jgi:hypothetical protein
MESIISAFIGLTVADQTRVLFLLVLLIPGTVKGIIGLANYFVDTCVDFVFTVIGIFDDLFNKVH